MNESVFNIHDVVLMFCIFECVLFVIFHITVFSFRKVKNSILNIFLLSIAVSSFGNIFLWNYDIHLSPGLSIGFAIMSMGSQALRAPLLYLYVQSLTQEHFTLKPFHLLHLMPAVACCVLVLSSSITLEILRSDTENLALISVVEGIWDIVKFVSLSYGAATIAVVWRNHDLLKQTHSEFSIKKFGWLRILVGGFFLNWTWSIVIQFVGRYIGGSSADIVGAAHNYMLFVIINALITYSLYYFFMQRKSGVGENDTGQNTPILCPRVIAKVAATVEKKNYHLEPNITLEELSLRIDLPIRTVSTVINKHYGKNFFDFINGYRIDTAKSLLIDPSKAHLSILEILSKSGFNSTSSFHRYFKRMVGLTPTEFRNENRSPSTLLG
ncbi:MAG: AraC-like DNA-binding protein [Flavobacteriales bacterium]|jgi:AraC-like DNA-binding protein